jgi:ribosomal protein S18 acetylase RimI-like enzyme
VDLQISPAVAADVEEMAAVHVAASQQAYAGIIPESALRAISVAERARRWAKALARVRPDEAILVGTESGNVVGLAHCGPQRTHTLLFAGEFYCIYVRPDSQRQRVGTKLMAAMARFLAAHDMRSASLWVARDNAVARRFYERLGGVIAASKKESRGDFVLAEVAYAWPDISVIHDGLGSQIETTR